MSVFFVVQSHALAHASIYGEDLHDHDGISCVMGTLVSDDAVILPPSEPSAFQRYVIQSDIMAIAVPEIIPATAQRYLFARAPPPSFI